MSLIHWWPLNGNLYDLVGNKNGTLLGTANVTTTGKLGKCLSGMTGTQTTAGVNVANCNLVDELSNTNYSFACWFKVHGTHVHYNGTIMSSGNWNKEAWAVGVSQNNTQIDVLDNKYNHWVSIGYTLTNEKWYHLVSVYQDGRSYIFLNGELIGTYSSTPIQSSDASNLTIGRETYAGGYFSFNGDICDVRVYDHALSLKEIKDLSKGLMIHYSFNDIGTEATTNLITSLSKGGQTTVNNTLGTVTTSGVSADTYFYLNLSEPMVEGETYTLQCIGENLPSGEYFRFPIGSQSNTSLPFLIYNGLNTYTFVANATAAGKTSVLMDDNYRGAYPNQCVFSHFQLEKKDHATPYIKGSRTGYIPDDSGNGYDAIPYNSELVKTTNNGSLAAKFNGSTSYYEVPVPRPDMFKTPYTLSFWINPDDDGRAIYFGDHQLTGGVSMNFERKSGGNFRYYHGGSPDKEVALKTPAGVWTMVTVTSDGTTMRFYQNGVEVPNSAYTFTPTITKSSGVMRIGRDNRSDATALAGLISDFRWYATALSAADVLELYEAKAEIDNENNFYSQEIDEEYQNSNILTVNSWEQGGVQDADGKDANNMANRLRTKFIPVLPSTQYYFGVMNTSMKVRGVHFYDQNNTWISYSTGSGVKTTPTNCAYVRWIIQNTTDSTATPLSDIVSYGPVMAHQQQNSTQNLLSNVEVQIKNTYNVNVNNICEGHDNGIFADGTLTGKIFYEF